MSVVSLELFKKHTRSDDFGDDDVLLQHYLDSAEESVVRQTHRTREELLEMGGGQMPQPLIQAVMLLAAHWYNQRESVSVAQMNAVPDSLQSLILQYRKLGYRKS